MNKLKVGDKIRVQNTFNDYVVEIERVTKTMAITKPINGWNHCLRFRLEYMGLIKPVSKQRFDTTTYTLL